MSSAWRDSIHRYVDPRGKYEPQPNNPDSTNTGLPNPYDPSEIVNLMETGAYQVGPPPPSGAPASTGASQMEATGSSSSNGKHRPALTIPQLSSNGNGPSSSSSQDEKKPDPGSPITPATTLIHGHAGGDIQPQQTGHIHTQSVATSVAARGMNRMSRIREAAPSERTRIFNGAYAHWPERPEPITAVLSIWQHFLWVFGTLAVVAGVGALGTFVCLHLTVSSAAWMVYIIIYFLLSFLFIAIMGHEMRLRSERKWKRILQNLTGGDMAELQERRQGTSAAGDNGRLSSDGQNYQIGEADETMATENGEAYALMESTTNAHKRQSVAFKTPDKPSPIKETHDAPECYVPTYTYNGYGAVATTSPNRKTHARASRAFQQVQRGADYVAQAAAAHSTEWRGGEDTHHRANGRAPTPVHLETPSSAFTANGHSGHPGIGAMKNSYAEPVFASPAEEVSMERAYTGPDRRQSYVADKDIMIDFANDKGKVVVGEGTPTERGSRQIFDGERYGMGHYHQAQQQRQSRSNSGDKHGRGNGEMYAKV